MGKIVTGILAHVDAGKTTLSESMLFNSGSLKRIGRVDNKDAFLDTDLYEKERGITIYSKVARMSYLQNEFILVDTPGHVDFSGEMERVLDILDRAILLINATDKVTSHTKTVWKLLRMRKIPTFIFVNKMDLPDASKSDILLSIRKELSKEAIDFSNTDSESFFEDIATGSEELLNSYMDNETISCEEISKAINESLIFPVFFGSALKNEGVKEFMDCFSKYCVEKKYGPEFSGICFKITKDKAGNRLTHLKITGGSLKVKDILKEEKVNEIRLISGDSYEVTKEAFSGDVVALTGLKASRPGETYGAFTKTNACTIEPVLTYAIKYPSDVDSSQMHKILLELEEEEPSLNIEFNEGTKDIYVHLMGEVQTEILTRKIEDLYNIKVSFGVGKILYKETITDTVEGVGHFEPLRHYAEVHLRMEPTERGSGLSFDTEVNVDDLALNWQRLILTHLGEKEHRGVLTGSPITDMKITLVAGKAHLKHTEGGDFRQATYRAVRQGLMMAESVLLEPFYFYELCVPNESVGRAMTDIDRMWGSATVTEQRNGESVIVGTAPVSTLNGYATEVLAYTKGKGTLSVSLSGYEPCHNTEEVLASRLYSPENDLRNPCDSVFCSHGAGTVIPWSLVYNYMHLPLTLEGPKEDKEDNQRVINTERKEVFVTTEEIDEIIKKTSYANQKGRQGSFKGQSEALREKRRLGGRKEEKEVVYKGTEQKDKYMLIDGYNVIHAWKELEDLASRDINAAAGRLMDLVSNYSGITGVKTILVFDAYKVSGHKQEEILYSNITVVYTKTAETADHYIERYAHDNGKKYDIVVVTSDGVEQVIIRGAGCSLLSSRDFEEDYTKKCGDLRETKLAEGINFV